MEEYTGAVRSRWRNILEQSIDGGIYWSSEMEEYTGAVRRINRWRKYWSSEEVNRWRNILEQ